MLGTLGHGQQQKPVLTSYMDLAEDEEIGRSERDSSLGENTATGKMQLHTHAVVKLILS